MLQFGSLEHLSAQCPFVVGGGNRWVKGDGKKGDGKKGGGKKGGGKGDWKKGQPALPDQQPQVQGYPEKKKKTGNKKQKGKKARDE